MFPIFFLEHTILGEDTTKLNSLLINNNNNNNNNNKQQQFNPKTFIKQ
jgi:hypothetical protein